MKNTQHSCWIITEGLIGTENQCVGVARALNLSPDIMRANLTQPWKTLSPYLGFECSRTFSPNLTPPWPDLLITSGRKAIAPSRYIKKQSKGQCFTLHIQDPRISSRHFDLVAVPKHDPLRGDNVIVTTAAPNKITPQNIKGAAKNFPELKLSDATHPYVAVMIGGRSKSHELTPEIMTALCAQLSDLCAQGYRLMITTSRRTGKENEAILHTNLHHKNAYIWDGSGDNPYLAMLDLAEFIIVTEDSTSMLSDAASTGKPTYVIELKGGSPRLDTMQQNLKDYGAIRDFNGSLKSWHYAPLNDAQLIADIVKQKLDWL